MTKLQQLTKAIHEAVPEILELKFGCRIKMKGGLQREAIVTSIFESQGVIGVAEKPDSCTWNGARSVADARMHAEEDFEILGRDITLADVLRVIEKEYWDNPMANDSGHDWYICKTVKLWNLEQNALHLQSEETINFLFDVICKKK